jgi:hypothetical protein
VEALRLLGNTGCALESLNRIKVLSSNLQEFHCAVMLLLETIIKAARYYNK